MTINYKLLDSMILPEGTSLENFEIFEGLGGAPILIPVRRADNPIDKIQREQGREWITNCPPATAQEIAREKSKKEYTNVIVIPGGYTMDGHEQPKESMSAIYGTRKEKTYTFLNQQEIHS